MSYLHHIRTLGLWFLWAALTVTWLYTIGSNVLDGRVLAALLPAIALALLVVLYFAEGLELAATDLLDKDPSQVRDPASRSVLSEIQHRPRFFYAQRQVFVVAIISFTSLVTTEPWIALPFLGREDNKVALFLFSFLLTTFTVLWFCQVTPKQLAVINSERFLGQSKFTWKLIQLMGLLGITGPSDDVVSLIERTSAYREKRHLRPSKSSHYNVSAQLYGFALDTLETTITIAGDGEAQIRKRFLALFLHGRNGVIYGYLETQSWFKESPEVRLLGLYSAPIPERLEELAGGLNAIFNGGDPGPDSRFSPNLLDSWPATTHVEITPRLDHVGESVSWLVEGPVLPESFWDETQEGEAEGQLVALLYEVDARIGEGGLGYDQSWPEPISLPCRRYALTVESTPDSGVALVLEPAVVTLDGPDAEFVSESAELVQQSIQGNGALVVDFPLPGMTYTARWRAVRSPQLRQ